MEPLDNPKISNGITIASFLLEAIDFFILHWSPILSIILIAVLGIIIFIQTSKRKKLNQIITSLKSVNANLESMNTELSNQIKQLQNEKSSLQSECNELKNKHTTLQQENEKIIGMRMAHWESLTEETRDVILKNRFSIFDALALCVEKIKDILPADRSKYRITIVRPLCDERFELLWCLGKDDISNSNLLTWKKEEEENEGLFSRGLREISVDVPYKVYQKNDTSYSCMPRKHKSTSEYHFMIPLKDKKYRTSQFPQKCIGLISIGIPKEYNFSEQEYNSFYQKMYPYVANIELFIQTYILFKNKIEILCRGLIDMP